MTPSTISQLLRTHALGLLDAWSESPRGTGSALEASFYDHLAGLADAVGFDKECLGLMVDRGIPDVGTVTITREPVPEEDLAPMPVVGMRFRNKNQDPGDVTGVQEKHVLIRWWAGTNDPHDSIWPIDEWRRRVTVTYTPEEPA